MFFITDSASVVVHVINGEHPAAMQHGNNSATTLIPSYRRRRMLSSSLTFNGDQMTSFYAKISTLYSILWSIIDFMIATNCCLVILGICLSQRLLHTSGRPNHWLNR